MCRVLGVSSSGYYAWCKCEPSPRRKRREDLLNEIQQSHIESRCTYRSPRVCKELNARGVKACENTVAKLLRQAEIRAKTARKYVPKTTDSKHEHLIAANVLGQDLTAEQPNKKWVSDTTYIPTGERGLYVAAVPGLCTRLVVGSSM